MRQALITFVASVLGALAALLGYRYFVQPPVPAPAPPSAAADRPLRPGEALDDRMVREERAIEAIRGDLIAIAGAKTAVAEYYLSIGRVPGTNTEVGLPAAAEYRGRSLRSLSVGEAGRLVLVFDALSGREGGIIEFVPDFAAVGAMGVQWRCTTKDYPRIVRALPSCEYRSADAADSSTTGIGP